MKRITIYLVTLIFAIALFSCNGGETNNENENSDTTEIENSETTEVENSNTDSENLAYEDLIIGKWLTIIMDGDEYPFKDYHTFNADGSFVYEDSSFRIAGTWEIKDNHVITTTNKEKITDDWGEIVSIKDNKLILKDTETNKESVFEKQ